MDDNVTMTSRRQVAANPASDSTHYDRPSMTLIAESNATNTSQCERVSNDGNSLLEMSTTNARSSTGRHDPTTLQHTERPLSIEEQYEYRRGEAKIRHWKESEFAVGCVEPTWSDELESYRLKRAARRNRRTRANGGNAGGGGLVWQMKEGAQDFKEGVEEACSGCCQDEIDPGCGCVYLSAVICSRLGAGRIGNMAVLKEKYIIVEEEVNDEAESEDDEEIDNDIESGKGKGEFSKVAKDDVDDDFRDKQALDANKSTSNTSNNRKKTRMVRRREIQLIVGPFWPMLLCITYPLIFTVSFFAAWSGLRGRPLIVKIIWVLLTGQLIRSLFNTSFRDPGILRKRKTPPPVEDDYDSDDSESNRRRRRIAFRWGNANGPWRWSDQAQSYRPKSSMYDPDCKVVVEEFDHT
ncbi:hypothetical protein ACHAXS_008938 [Conticribra weissflogii]